MSRVTFWDALFEITPKGEDYLEKLGEDWNVIYDLNKAVRLGILSYLDSVGGLDDGINIRNALATSDLNVVGEDSKELSRSSRSIYLDTSLRELEHMILEGKIDRYVGEGSYEGA